MNREDVLRIAFAHLVLGIDQHKIAAMYGINSGRVAEIVKAIRHVADNHMETYRGLMTTAPDPRAPVASGAQIGVEKKDD